jgi:transposase-like protein
MPIHLAISCPHCHGTTIVRNGKKYNEAQNYLCKDCGRQFIAGHERACRGSLPEIADTIKSMLVRGVGIRDTAVILQISVNKILKTLVLSTYTIKPKQSHYESLKVDEFWTYWAGKRPRFGLSMLIIALPMRL